MIQAKPKSNDEWDKWVSDQDKELQQIFQGQSAIKEVLTELHRKMDDIVARQERSFLVLGTLQVTIIFNDGLSDGRA